MGHDLTNQVTLVVWTNLTVSLDGSPTANALMLRLVSHGPWLVKPHLHRRVKAEHLGLRRLTLAGALAKLRLLASSTLNPLVLTGDLGKGVSLLIGERARP